MIMPAHGILVLIAPVSSECLDEPVHPKSFARAFAARMHKVWKYSNTQVKHHLAPFAACACLNHGFAHMR